MPPSGNREDAERAGSSAADHDDVLGCLRRNDFGFSADARVHCAGNGLARKHIGTHPRRHTIHGASVSSWLFLALLGSLVSAMLCPPGTSSQALMRQRMGRLPSVFLRMFSPLPEAAPEIPRGFLRSAYTRRCLASARTSNSRL